MVSATCEANPHVPSTITRTARPSVVSSWVVGDRAVPQVDQLAEDPLHPDVGMLGAELAGPAQRGVGQLVQRERAELVVHVALRVSVICRGTITNLPVAATAAGAAY